MKTYIADIIPKIQAYSKKLDELVKLSNHHWVSLDEIGSSKIVYIFRPDNKLIISDNGIVQKATWEYIGNGSMVIDANNGSFLLKQGFLDDNILAFKMDGTERYVIFVNETRYDKELNSLNDILRLLEEKYLRKPEILGLPKTDVEIESSVMDTSDKLILILILVVFFAIIIVANS